MEFFRSKLYYFDKTFDDIEANMLEDVNNTIKRDIDNEDIVIVAKSEDENYMQTIISENESLKSDIQRKKELLEKLKELTKENEALRLQNKKLNDEIDKIVLDIQNHGHQKTLHL